MRTILPCPWCGKQPKIQENQLDEIFAMVYCDNRRCPAMPTVMDSRRVNAYKTTAAAVSAAIRRWNICA